MLFDNAVYQRLGRCRIVDIQVFSGTARKCSENVADFCSAIIACCRANHLQALLGQFKRNGGTDAARRAGDQRNLPLKLDFAHASISFTSASEAGSNKGAPVNSGSILLTMPANTLPGPHSTRVVTPSALTA